MRQPPDFVAYARQILERAIEDGAVAPMTTAENPDRMEMTPESLAGVVGVLKRLARAVRESD